MGVPGPARSPPRARRWTRAVWAAESGDTRSDRNGQGMTRVNRMTILFLTGHWSTLFLWAALCGLRFPWEGSSACADVRMCRRYFWGRRQPHRSIEQSPGSELCWNVIRGRKRDVASRIGGSAGHTIKQYRILWRSAVGLDVDAAEVLLPGEGHSRADAKVTADGARASARNY